MPRRLSLATGRLPILLLLVACEQLPVQQRAENNPLQSPELRVGWIRDRRGEPMRVVYTVHKGSALWQGDIDLGPADLIAETREQLEKRGPQLGAAIDDEERRWPNGRVPIVVDPSLQARVDSAVTYMEARVKGLDFVASTSDYWRIDVIPADVCSSFIGRAFLPQELKLAPTCGFGYAMHEFGHALGLYHEQSRCDRDSFVEILTDNIRSGYVDQFAKQCGDATDYFAYDESSIMHYDAFAWSKNRLPTIRSLRGRDADMGQRDSLPLNDIKTLRALYPYWLSTGISGEQFLQGDPANYTWTTGAAGGVPPYHFTWRIDRTDPYGDVWNSLPEGDGSTSLTMYIDRCDGSFALGVFVTDSDPYGSYTGQTAPFVIDNWITSPSQCGVVTVSVGGPGVLYNPPGQITWSGNVSGGTPPYSYVWYIDRVAPYGDGWEVLAGQNNATLTLYVDACTPGFTWADQDPSFALLVAASNSSSPTHVVENFMTTPEPWECP